MDLRYSAEADTFREKMRAFLAEHLPALKSFCTAKADDLVDLPQKTPVIIGGMGLLVCCLRPNSWIPGCSGEI